MTDLYIPIAQIILAVAMLAVAVLCIRLDRKITALREGKDGVAAAATELALAVGRAEASVTALKSVSEAAGEDLQRAAGPARDGRDRQGRAGRLQGEHPAHPGPLTVELWLACAVCCVPHLASIQFKA
jgi:hypothetical protein